MKNKLFLVLLISFLLFSCKKDDEEAYKAEYTITTGTDALLNGRSAVAKGKLRLTSGTIKDYGHCWSEYQNPTLESDNSSSFGECSASLEFFSDMDNLKISTNYFVRTYAKDASGTIYGNEVVIRTTDLNVWKVNVLEQSTSSVNLSAGVEVTSMAPVKYGFCWAEHENPTIDDHKAVSNNLSNNVIYKTIKNLPSNKPVYIRAYAFLGFTSYGKVLELNLNGVILDSLEYEILSDTSIRVSTEFDVNTNIKDHGICYAIDKMPDINDSKSTLGSHVGSGISQITINDLTRNEYYNLRAYVITENDSVYYSAIGNVTLNSDARCYISGVEQFNNLAIKLNSSFYANCGILDHGVCWATNSDPQISDSILSFGDPLIQNHNWTIIRLPKMNETYYVRSYIVNRYNEAIYSDATKVDFFYPMSVPELSQYSKWGAIKFDIDNKQYYGLCRDNSSSNLFYFNQGNISWVKKADFPEPNLVHDYYNESHTSNEAGYIFCLLSNDNVKTYRYFPETNSWSEYGEFDPPHSVDYLSSIVVNNEVYVLLATRYGGQYLKLYRVSNSGNWELIKTINRTGYHQISFAIGNTLYITKDEKLCFINLDDLEISQYHSKPAYSDSDYDENWAHYFEYKEDIYFSFENQVYKFYPNNNSWVRKRDLGGFSDESTSVIIGESIFIGMGGCGYRFVRYIP